MTNTAKTPARRATHVAVPCPLLQPQAIAARPVRLVRAVILGLLSILLTL